MQLSARGAQKTRNESKKLSMYSKQWLPGDVLRTFYPIYWDENGEPQIAVGAVWGHNVSDIKGLGLKTAFIPSTTDFDENALPIGPADITYQFSRIAQLFVNGQKKADEAAIARKNWPNEAARKEALKAIEVKYDTKNNMQAVKPIIGRAQYYISTEVISIKVVNGMAQADSVAITSCPLSNQTIDRLYGILDDPKYKPQPGENFLEVEWKYPVNTDKGQSAKAATPAGLTAEYRLSNQDPAGYQKVEAMFGQVATDSDTIKRRATRSVDMNRVKQAIAMYSFLNAEYLDIIDEEDEETLMKNVELIKELDVTRALTNTELVGKINAELAKVAEMSPVVEMPSVNFSDVASNVAAAATPSESTTPVPPVTSMDPLASATAVDPLASAFAAVTGAPSLQSLMQSSNNAATDEANIQDVNLDV